MSSRIVSQCLEGNSWNQNSAWNINFIQIHISYTRIFIAYSLCCFLLSVPFISSPLYQSLKFFCVIHVSERKSDMNLIHSLVAICTFSAASTLYSVWQPVRPSHFINKISREKRSRDKSISFYATLKIYRADSKSSTTISKPAYIWLWFCVTARFKSRLSQPSKTVQGSPCTLPNYQIWECIEGPTKKMS